MSTPTCPSCKNHSFELVEAPVAKSAYRLNFIQCSSCGTPIGIHEYFNSGAKIIEQTELINNLTNKISHIEHTLDNIDNLLRRMSQK